MHLEMNKTINHPLSDVWAKFADWGGIWRFQPWVVSSPLLSERPQGVGASRRCEFVDDTSIVETVTRFEPERMIELELSEAPGPMKGGTSTIALKPLGDRTDVTITIDVTLGIGPLNPIIGGLMMKPMMRKRVTRMLESVEFHLTTGGKLGPKGEELLAPAAAE